MEKETTHFDLLGDRFDRDYGGIITDHTFEARLKAYDDHLKLMFDQRTKRWKVLEWARDNTGWRILMSCEDDFGNPAAPGDWIFSHLHDMKKRHEAKLKRGAGEWLNDMHEQCNDWHEAKQKKLSEEAQYQVRHEINEWRRAAALFLNEPTSDVTAGYQKVKPKQKGTIVCP